MFERTAEFLRGAIRRKDTDRWLRVYLDTNWTCNLICRICLHSLISHSPIEKGSMGAALFEKIARDVFPRTRHLSLSCSAEPLMSDMFLTVLKRIGDYNIPYVDFISNAVLLDARKTDAILSSGVDLMCASLDSADKDIFERIRRGADFDKVIGNLERFRDTKRKRGLKKPALRISAVLMRSNIEGIEDLMRLAQRLGAEGIHFRHLIPFAHLVLSGESLFHHKELANEYISRAQALAEELNFDTLHLPAKFTGGEPSGNTEPIRCRIPWEVVFIRANGNVIPCESSLTGTVMGNLVEQSFDEVWNSPGYAKLREELVSGNYRESCMKCPAVVSGCTSSPMAFQEVTIPAVEEMLQLIESGAAFDTNVAILCNKSLTQCYMIKPEYDLLCESGVTAEKIGRWEKWYETTLKIHAEFGKGVI